MKIEHTALYAGDIEVMKEFFVKYFGASANSLYHNPKTDFKSYFLSFKEGCRLEIMNRPDMLPTDNTQNRKGFIHIAFSAGSKEAVDALTERLKKDGCTVLSSPRTTGDGYYESCIAGPEGIEIEISE